MFDTCRKWLSTGKRLLGESVAYHDRLCYYRGITKEHERHKTVNYTIEKIIASNERGKTVIVKKNKGKKFFWAFIANNGTLTIVSKSGYNTLEEAVW